MEENNVESELLSISIGDVAILCLFLVYAEHQESYEIMPVHQRVFLTHYPSLFRPFIFFNPWFHLNHS